MDKILQELAEQSKKINAQRRARALVLAIEWAGSVSTLSVMLGQSRWAAQKWVQRGGFPSVVAVALSKFPGFPVPLAEMLAGHNIREYKHFNCPRCHAYLTNLRNWRGSDSLLKNSYKRIEKGMAIKAKARPRKYTRKAIGAPQQGTPELDNIDDLI